MSAIHRKRDHADDSEKPGHDDRDGDEDATSCEAATTHAAERTIGFLRVPCPAEVQRDRGDRRENCYPPRDEIDEHKDRLDPRNDTRNDESTSAETARDATLAVFHDNRT